MQHLYKPRPAVTRRTSRRKGGSMIPLIPILAFHAIRALLARKRGPEIQPLYLESPPVEYEPEPPPPPPEPLCHTCAFAQVTRGAAPQEELTFCIYGGFLRVLPFIVRECSEYRERAV